MTGFARVRLITTIAVAGSALGSAALLSWRHARHAQEEIGATPSNATSEASAAAVTGLAFAPDGSALAVARADASVMTLDPRTAARRFTVCGSSIVPTIDLGMFRFPTSKL